MDLVHPLHWNEQISLLSNGSVLACEEVAVISLPRLLALLWKRQLRSFSLIVTMITVLAGQAA